MGRRHTFEYVKKKFEDKGYKLLSKTYINCYTKLRILCNKNHEFSSSFSAFQQGSRCPTCFRERQSHTFEYVKKEFEDKGYTLLSDTYVNGAIKLKVRCPNGHVTSKRFCDFKQGKMCIICAGTNKLTIEYVEENFRKYGYTLLSEKYINSGSYLWYMCPVGHIHKIVWSNWKTGYRCPTCSNLKNKGSGWKGGVTARNIALYETYAPQLDFCEEVRRDPDEEIILQVRCTNTTCRKWFTPSDSQTKNRANALKGTCRGDQRFYCSEECKHECTLFRQVKFPKDYKPYVSRQNQPEWAAMVKERDNYECQKCGATEKLVAHHMEGLNANPLMSADVDIGITLCKECHKKVHKELGCRFTDMKC